MYKKWKSVAALGMAVLIGCMMPVSTMMAAEGSQEDIQEIEVNSDSDNDTGSDSGVILDDENADNEENVDDGIVNDENVGDETDAVEDENPGDEENADDENASDKISADEDEYADIEMDIDNYGIALMSEAGGAETGDIETLASTAAPVITITLQGQDYTRSLGGKVDFKYVNINKVSQVFECSASQAVSLSYCLEQVYADAVAKDKGWMNSMTWQDEQPSFSGGDAHYVLYVKAVGADGQTVYARSDGVVVDTESPKVTGVEDGKTYPEGTLFQVEDKNLESVTVNEKPVTPASGGSYQVSANGTSCVIKAKDKAGNEMICSITVSGKDLAENDVISENGIYSLKAGTPYQLAAGKWQVSGDKSVYLGDSTFYVKTSGDYTFTKR